MLHLPPPPQGIWTGKGQLGYLDTTGNTDSTAFNAILDMALLEDPWKHELHLGGQYGSSSGITSAERWDARLQSNYAFSTDLFVFGGLRYEHDLFDGFQFQASGTAGLGYQIISTAASKLAVQIGAGYRDLRPEELTKAPNSAVTSRTLEPSNSGAVGTAGLDYTQVLSTSTALTDHALIRQAPGILY